MLQNKAVESRSIFARSNLGQSPDQGFWVTDPDSILQHFYSPLPFFFCFPTTLKWFGKHGCLYLFRHLLVLPKILEFSTQPASCHAMIFYLPFAGDMEQPIQGQPLLRQAEIDLRGSGKIEAFSILCQQPTSHSQTIHREEKQSSEVSRLAADCSFLSKH